jgi:hypothetical protein
MMNKLLTMTVAILASVISTGCATGYGKSKLLFNEGYTDTKISSDTYKVEFRASEAIQLQSTYAYAMRRAAELSLQNGYSYFEVLDKKTLIVNASYDTAYGLHYVKEPDSILKIKFVKSKTASAYNAKKIMNRLL